MKRLFVDVDNTLIHWIPSGEFGVPDTDWQVNQHVLDFVQWWGKTHQGGVITVWSSNGREYAKEWAERVVPDSIRYVVAAKKAFKASKDDTFIDDRPWPSFYSGDIIFHPDDLKSCC